MELKLLFGNCDVHYISNGLTSRQHNKLTSKIKELMKTKRTALLGRHRHCMNTNFNTLGRGPIIACQVWVANMEMAIKVAKVATGNFCMQETLRQLRTPLILPTIQHTPITTTINIRNTSPNPPPIYHAPIITPRTCACQAQPSLHFQNHTLTTAHQSHPTTLPCSPSSLDATTHQKLNHLTNFFHCFTQWLLHDHMIRFALTSTACTSKRKHCRSIQV